MFNVMSTKLLLSVVLVALLPTLTPAATPKAYLEQSEVIATGRQIRAYRVPTKDVNGVIKYYDLTVTFNVLDDGKIDTTTASIVSTASPNIFANQFIPGTYKTLDRNTSCNMTVSILSGGRMQGALACNDSAGYTISASWVSGPITGHPFELDLRAAGIDTIPGYRNFSWGKIGQSDRTFWGCMNTGEISSATQVGSSIHLSGYGESNIQECGITLIKQ